jgi:hypothetical protein
VLYFELGRENVEHAAWRSVAVACTTEEIFGNEGVGIETAIVMHVIRIRLSNY